MRLVRLLWSAFFISIFASFGCGATGPAPPSPGMTAEQKEVEAARVFEVAQKLEKERQSKAAVAAYRHILRNFPETAHAKKAGARIKVHPRS